MFLIIALFMFSMPPNTFLNLVVAQKQEVTHKWFIDGNHGNDSKHCGSAVTPCKSLEHSWHLFEESVNKKQWKSEPVEFLLEPGFYTSYEVLPLFFSCENTDIPSIAVKSNHSVNPSDVVLSHSFFIEQCVIMFQNLTFIKVATFDFHGCEVSILDTVFTNITMAINFYECSLTLFSNIKISNATSPKYKQLIQVDTCVNFFILNSAISRSNLSRQILFVLNTAFIAIKGLEIDSIIGQRPWEGVYFTGVDNMDIVDMKMTNNINLPVLVYFIRTGVFHSLTFNNNYIDRNKASMHQNFITVVDSTIQVQDSTFSCNNYSDSNYGSAISYNKNSNFHCTSCSTGNCPVNCPAGHEVKENVLCSPCEPGTANNATDIKCKRCKEGTFAVNHGENNCTKCTAGKYCPKKGCTHCMGCESDFFTSNAGAKHCSKVTILTMILIVIFSLVLLFGLIIIIIKRCYPSLDKYDNLSENDAESDDVFTGGGNQEVNSVNENNNKSINT